MDAKTKAFRADIAELFIKSLEKPEVTWQQDWMSGSPRNAYTGNQYRGLNLFSLYLYSRARGYTDMRFATFKQIQAKRWHLKAGSKGFKVEYWYPWDYENHVKISWEEFNRLRMDRKNRFGLRAFYSTVFNVEDIEGIPPLEVKKTNIQLSDLVEKIAKNMGITISNDHDSGPVYRLHDDSIHMPRPELFETDYGYNSGILHEETHATGAAHRLNRPSLESYSHDEIMRAYEELVAEIGATFMSLHLQMSVNKIAMTEKERENHIAYVQGWSKSIKKDPEILIKAIRDAEAAADYLEYQAELIPESEYLRNKEKVMEFDDGIDIEKILTYCRNKEQLLETVKKIDWHVHAAKFDPLGNVVQTQAAEYLNGGWRAELRFINRYDPRVLNLYGQEKMASRIELLIRPEDEMEISQAKLLVLQQKKSQSTQNAQKNYKDLLAQWMDITNQKEIYRLKKELSPELELKIKMMEAEGQKISVKDGKVLVSRPNHQIKEHLTQEQINELASFAKGVPKQRPAIRLSEMEV